jgi:hypothetical protein
MVREREDPYDYLTFNTKKRQEIKRPQLHAVHISAPVLDRLLDFIL